MSATITPYLFLSGRTDEALKFYEKVLGAQVEMVMRFNESPEPPPPGMLQEGFEKKVMHASFTLLGNRIFCSDGCDDKSTLHGFSLAVAVPNEAEANRVFNALASEGGTVKMPLTKTFWSPAYGMLTDKFNVEWMVMVPGEAPPSK